ncbi:uncharacterized protein BXZ73DRAFT_106164 [Epithele typhae]|uniref:uncharacterized protein n=1 Tax=Epithele typhae TaxID=378194 RepID=UPI002007E010|nr:uncharacterized protein BXZ73DRAFT_106164 [Epithele typhae]KAH9915435.1 hypothetical protein BXZ73DRAFT_106164 [Epithele typhae]
MRALTLALAALLSALALLHPSDAQTPTLGLADGFLSFDTADFKVQLVKDSQTLYSLQTKDGFDFIPADVMDQRQYDGNYHLGDLTFRARVVGQTAWTNGDTSSARKNVTQLAASGSTLAAAHLAPTLPGASLLNITRRWALEDGELQLLFDVTNSQSEAVEIGSLGAPLEFNNIFTDRTAAETNTLCSLFDPYIGQDGGYVQVTPLLGTLPPLLVLPLGGSPLEGWRFLPEDESQPLGYQSQTFEGLYEWQFHTLAYAQDEWAAVTPWNAPTSAVLPPGTTRTYGLRFALAPSIRAIEDTLRAKGRPVVVGVPGFVLPADQEAKLFVNYTAAVRALSVEPAGALSWTADADGASPAWTGYTITANGWGRSRLTVNFTDGTSTTVHWYATHAAAQVVADLGHFLTTESWFDDPTDPFKRSPSVISYDSSVNAVVRNDPRAWIPGLSDEAGAGSWLAAAVKQFAQPNAAEVAKMERFVNETLWGSVQNKNGTVKKSVFFYQPTLVPNYTYPSSMDWTVWWSWNEASSYATDRAYDYVHVIAAYWSLYRVARNYPSLVTTHDWRWYLNQAVLTVATMTNGRVGYADVGLMEETVIRYLLDDLQREGLSTNATLVESRMKARESIWAGEQFPFGSEMAWDSTGQEGVFAWATYFNDTTTATNALNSILAYQPSIPHWGYNGNARRYWDNVYGGKLQRIERQIHHYGSALNAIPLLTRFRTTPADTHLLRVGFAGSSAPLASVDARGFAAASFHSFADTLAWDAYSGDYGPGFVGLALEAGTYLVRDAELGWLAFGGTVRATTAATVRVAVRDAVRRRVFVAPLGAWLTLDAGAFDEFTFEPAARRVTLNITAAASGVQGAAAAPRARLVVQNTADNGLGVLRPTTKLAQDAGAYVIPFAHGVASVTLTL